MTTWWELGLTVVGWGALCFGLFHLGRLWERDHPWSPKPMTEDRFESWLIEQEKLETRRGPYNWENEDIFYGPHRRG